MATDGSNLATTAGDWWNPWPNYVQPYIQPAITYTITQTPRCAWCQGTHTDRCPDLKSVSYRRDGTVERVEFFERDS